MADGRLPDSGQSSVIKDSSGNIRERDHIEESDDDCLKMRRREVIRFLGFLKCKIPFS